MLDWFRNEEFIVCQRLQVKGTTWNSNESWDSLRSRGGQRFLCFKWHQTMQQHQWKLFFQNLFHANWKANTWTPTSEYPHYALGIMTKCAHSHGCETLANGGQSHEYKTKHTGQTESRRTLGCICWHYTKYPQCYRMYPWHKLLRCVLYIDTNSWAFHSFPYCAPTGQGDSKQGVSILFHCVF